jgi:hypothetical protein
MLHQHHQHFPTSSSTPTSLDEPGEAVAAGVVVTQSCDVDGEPDDGTRGDHGEDCHRAGRIGVGSPQQRRGETVLTGTADEPDTSALGRHDKDAVKQFWRGIERPG